MRYSEIDLQSIIDDQAGIMISVLTKRGYIRINGRNRVAMVSPDKRSVIKIPKNDEGILDNHRERRQFISTLRDGVGAYIQMASCRIFIPDEKAGVPMLIMQYVEPITYNNNLPKWVDCVDCAQVGYNRSGKLVAYDL